MRRGRPARALATLFLALGAACGSGAPLADASPDGCRAEPWDDALMPPGTGRTGTPSTCALFPPWPADGVWGFRAPETIRSDRGLLYIDYDRSAPEPILAVVDDGPWREEGARLVRDCELERGVRFRVEIAPDGPDELRIDARLWNDSTFDLADLEAQFCLVQNGVRGFEDPRAERTFVVMDGELVPLGATEPGLPDGGPPGYVVSWTPGEERAPPNAENSWRTTRPSDLPLIATVSDDGERWVAVAFENAFKLMTNCAIPCVHADPRLPDCARGGTVAVEGRVYFGAGPLDALLPRFWEDFPAWRP